jgi:hypothetical protein
MSDEATQPDGLTDAILAMVGRRMREEATGGAPMFPQAPPCSPALARSAIDKTNPIQSPAPAENKATAEVSAALPVASGCSTAHPRHNVDSTKQSHGGGPPKVRDKANCITPLKIRAVRLLLAGGRVGQVASALGVSRHTVSRWQKEPAFQAEARRQVDAAVPLAPRRAAAGWPGRAGRN